LADIAGIERILIAMHKSLSQSFRCKGLSHQLREELAIKVRGVACQKPVTLAIVNSRKVCKREV
jgi:hypothetical protein